MKKLINQVEDFVPEQLEGMAAAYPGLIRVNSEPRYVVRADAPVEGKVALVSGGGSGHEPMHGGFVGRGMLDGACPGEVFTSPTPDQMIACAQEVDAGSGVLFIVKNYTGDVLNFETAVEICHADGHLVQAILIDDDTAVKDSLYTAGRRGVGTTVLAEKIVGGAAEAGYNLARCADLCRRVNQYGRSIGIALSSCTVPAAGRPTFELGEDEFEFGIGIHGEPGRERMAMHTETGRVADEITERMANALLSDAPYTRTVHEWDREGGEWVEKTLTDAPFAAGDEVIAFVNSMGGTPLSELYVVYRRLDQVLRAAGLKIVRSLVGPYITSLDMQGVSITLLRSDAEILRFWDAPVLTPGLRWGA